MYPVLLCWTPDLPHPGHQQLRSLSGFCLSSVVFCSPRAPPHTGLACLQWSSVLRVLLHTQVSLVFSGPLFSACSSTHRSPLFSVVLCSLRATPHTGHHQLILLHGYFVPLLSAPWIRIPDLRCLSANSSSPRISHSRAVFTTPCHGAICDSELLHVISSHVLSSPISPAQRLQAAPAS